MGKLPLVILAAGKGRRLEPITNVTPKALLKFGDKTLTELLIRAFADAGVTNVIMCVGYKADAISQTLGMECCGLPIDYVFNPLFYNTGAGYSLRLAGGLWMHSDCIIVEGDQLIHPDIAKMLVDSTDNSFILVDSTCKPEYKEETIVIGNDGIVDTVVWPASDAPGGCSHPTVGEAIVMAYVPKRLGYKLYSKLGEGEIISPLDWVVTHYKDVHGLPWIEIDTLEDFIRAERIYRSALEELYREKL